MSLIVYNESDMLKIISDVNAILDEDIMVTDYHTSSSHKKDKIILNLALEVPFHYSTPISTSFQDMTEKIL